MKKFFIIAALMISVFSGAAAETKVTRQGNSFTVTSVKTSRQHENKKTDYSYTDTDGKTYTIYLSKNGRAYILRTSKNGNEYKKYLGEEISRTICSELGVEYKDNSKK